MILARRQLESKWRKDRSDQNLAAVKALIRRYTNALRLGKKAFNIKIIL